MTSHRGAHPEDDDQFARSQIRILRAAVHDLAWLRSRGYGDASSVKMVGDRYRLTRRQRDAVARSACTHVERAHRLVRRREPTGLSGEWIAVDGFNVLIAVEGLFGGAYLFIGRDRAYRDVNPVQGTYRLVEETEPAIEAVCGTMADCDVEGITWWLDAHVSNVGRLKSRLAALAPSSIGWEIQVRERVDERLAASDQLVATSDSAILDRVKGWCSVEQAVCAALSGDPNVRDLRPGSDRLPLGGARPV
jgi:hypothetical protein